MNLTRRSFLFGGLMAASAGMSACTSTNDPRPSATPGGSSPVVSSATGLRMGISAPPMSTDPSIVADIDSQRFTRQIFQNLVGVDPNTGAPIPQLALSWNTSEDNLTHTFTLDPAVEFHDGTPLTADLVVDNFTRWAATDQRMGEAFIRTSPRLAFPTVFGGYAKDETYLVDEFSAVDDYTFRISLTEPIHSLVEALTDPAFGISAPKSWKTLDQEIARNTSSAQYPHVLSLAAVAGSGGYRWDGLSSSESPSTLSLTPVELTNASADLELGEPLTFKTVADIHQRLYGLRSKQLDVIEPVTASVLQELVQSGTQVLQRDPMSVLYLGMNQNHPVLESLAMRQAVAYALDRAKAVEKHMLSGSYVAHQFVPPSLLEEGDDLKTYSPSLKKARELIASTGYDGEPLEFLYPTGSDRPYLTQPDKLFALFSGQLARAGLNIVPKPLAWDSGYFHQIHTESSTRAFHLSGRNLTYRDPLMILDALFGVPTPEFAWTNSRVAKQLQQARKTVNTDKRNELFHSISRSISLDLPAVPLAFPITAVATGDRVKYFPVSPVLDERLHLTRLEEENS